MNEINEIDETHETHQTSTGMRHHGWRPPTYNPDEATIARSDPWMMSPGVDPAGSGCCHDITYSGDASACWPEALALLREAGDFGYEVHCMMLDGRTGLEPCKLGEFDNPPALVQVFETSGAIELTWL